MVSRRTRTSYLAGSNPTAGDKSSIEVRHAYIYAVLNLTSIMDNGACGARGTVACMHLGYPNYFGYSKFVMENMLNMHKMHFM